jgi:transcription elongation factor GreA
LNIAVHPAHRLLSSLRWVFDRFNVEENSMSAVPVTVEGKKKMQAELDELTSRVPVVAKAIADAREKGDLKENAEYHAAREDMGMLNARIGELKSKLAYAVVVDESLIDTSRIAFGAKIVLLDLKDKSEEDWQLIGDGEDDPLENKILTTSPMGAALIGKKLGETVTVDAPAGPIKFKVKKISY